MKKLIVYKIILSVWILLVGAAVMNDYSGFMNSVIMIATALVIFMQFVL